MCARIPVVFALLSLLLVAGATKSDAASSAADRAQGGTLAQAPSERAEAMSGVAPVMVQPAPMSLPGGTTADQVLHATDGDGDPITFSKSFGPAYMTVTTVSPGTGSATGNVHLAPSLADQGVVSGGIVASDGTFVTAATLEITVTGPDRPPVLAQPLPMSGRAGQTIDQVVSASDPDADPLTFTKASGPAFMSVQTLSATEGLVRLSTTASDSGATTGTVRVSDGQLTDQKSFSITIRVNTPPSIDYIPTLFVTAGSTFDFSLYSTDAEGDSVVFSKAFGPNFMTVSTPSSGPGFAYGNINLAPGLSQVGSYNAAVAVSDGALGAQSFFGIIVNPVNSPPVLSQPADMTVTLGEVAEQMITATDPNGDFISFSKVSGPAYVDVFGYGYGQATGTIRATPGTGDAGVATVRIQAADYQLADTKSFTITAVGGNFPPPCGAEAFTPLTTSFGFGTIEVQTADLNGDAVLDLVVELPGSGRLIVALGVGDGTFGEPTDLQAENNPVSGVVADFNGDGKLDIATPNYNSNNVAVYLGDGAGGFGPKHNFTVGFSPRSIVAADVNRDGKMDLMTANQSSASVSLLRGVGNGTFLTAISIPAKTPWHLAAPDLNGDGAPDLVVVNPGYSDISVYLNNGSGTYGSRTDYPVGNSPLAVAAADLNEDGKVDLAVTSSGSNFVSVFLGVGNGTLSPKRNFPTHFSPRLIAILDINGDHHLDLGITNLDSDDTSILLGDGSGAFGPHTDVPTGGGPYGIAFGDFDDDLRNDLAVANYFEGSVTILLNGCAPRPDHPPVVKAPKTVSGPEGSEITFSISASDPDGPAISSLTPDFSGLPVGHNATFTPGPANTTGVFRWTPGYQHSRPTPYQVTFTATNVLSGSASTKITVTDINRAPTANAGGPYTAFAGSPLSLDGTGSSDPDGDPLSFLWVFGDGATGTGATPVHTYASVGLYGVAVTASDGLASSLATTTANIVGVFQARAFTASGNRSIRLGSGKPQWCGNLEPIGRSFSLATVDFTSLVMKSLNTGSVGEIHAIVDRSVVIGDQDANGVNEITACFRKDDLRLLFSNLHGNTPVTVTFEGRLFTGGIFRAQMDVLIMAGGGKLAALVSPNPLNPEAILTFRTTEPGPVRVRLFDLNGRMIRSLLDESNAPAGYHDVRIDGRDEHGGRLASGLYFFRIDAREGEVVGKVSVLK
ncbi:MAG: PKD domain-containing protein [Candidatus Eisenbacteria bacterium]|uniref:PKD domain-containing protein n=1 Tax=Eiseniibacteriota bacterium TaxID=2212470 RepID=A0A538SMF0_UNCEI|nr:MAG: PKD domain-containing protein [Candidatus Eisenbacteria bacterium]